MILVDSHCHLNRLDLAPYENNLYNVLEEAEQKGVRYFLCVAVTLDDFPELLAMAQKYSNVAISVGLHPNEKPQHPLDKSFLEQHAKNQHVVAIGETGLDYYRSQGDLHWQHERFIQHIECAITNQKPLIIHTRQAQNDTIELMRNHQASVCGGVMHCFTENWDMAKKALDLGFYISFSGITTFKSAVELQEVAKKVPLDRMLIETDSPYLAPVPFRGKPNVPAHVYFKLFKIKELAN